MSCLTRSVAAGVRVSAALSGKARAAFTALMPLDITEDIVLNLDREWSTATAALFRIRIANDAKACPDELFVGIKRSAFKKVDWFFVNENFTTVMFNNS